MKYALLIYSSSRAREYASAASVNDDFVAYTRAALGAVPPADMGRASGVNNTLQRFGGALGVAIATAVFTAYGHLGSPASVISGYRPAMAVSAGLSLLGAMAAVAVGRRQSAASGATPDHLASIQPAADRADAARRDPAGLQTVRR